MALLSSPQQARGAATAIDSILQSIGGSFARKRATRQAEVDEQKIQDFETEYSQTVAPSAMEMDSLSFSTALQGLYTKHGIRPGTKFTERVAAHKSALGEAKATTLAETSGNLATLYMSGKIDTPEALETARAYSAAGGSPEVIAKLFPKAKPEKKDKPFEQFAGDRGQMIVKDPNGKWVAITPTGIKAKPAKDGKGAKGSRENVLSMKDAISTSFKRYLKNMPPAPEGIEGMEYLFWLSEQGLTQNAIEAMNDIANDPKATTKKRRQALEDLDYYEWALGQMKTATGYPVPPAAAEPVDSRTLPGGTEKDPLGILR